MAEDPGRAPVLISAGGSGTGRGAVASSRRELVAWLSHDLCAPLARIRALLEMLEDGAADDPETIAHYHRTLRQESDRLTLLLDDLLELAGSPSAGAGSTVGSRQ